MTSGPPSAAPPAPRGRASTSTSGAAHQPYALVAVARPVRGEFTYRIPPGLAGQLQPGQRLEVPFGSGRALGFYLGEAPPPSPEVLPRLKPIGRLLDERPALSADVVELARFAAAYYRYPLGEALRAALPPGLSAASEERAAGPDVTTFARAAEGASAEGLGRAPAQAAVLSYLLAVGGRAPVDEVSHAIPGARAHLKRLAERGLVHLETEVIHQRVQPGLDASKVARLTPEQANAFEVLERALAQGGFRPFLLHGVTGSGKTEVYLRLVEASLRADRGALVLVPEIALTPQLVGRFRSRFGAEVAVLHSGLRDKERLHAWQALRAGTVRIAVGVRSAIWAPVPRLGVVVVDEEHDPSFKQEEKLRYHARDLALVRAQQAGCLVVLGSATPSLETLENVRRGRYEALTLTRRVDDRPMPTVQLVDLRVARPRTPETRGTEPPVLSGPAREAIADTLGRGQQAILFLNRRGHATFVTCEVCGQTLKCEDCDVCLTAHRASRRLQCHYCGRASFMPPQCPSCGGPLLELGVGTERLEAEVAEAFPRARVARLDRDAASNAEALTQLLARFARRELDVLVGTQMVAKGHDFPGVTLVCVVLADTALSLPDFRASERTFHLLTQVAGRAGRGVDPGRVLVQSYNPEAPPVARMLEGDFAAFSRDELERRRVLAWPPYTRMAAVRVEGDGAELTTRVAQHLGHIIAASLPHASRGVRLLGPAPAPITRIKGRTRWQLVLKAPTHRALGPPLDALERALDRLPSGVKVVIDVDPVAML